MTSISLGMPQPPAPVLAPRRKSRKITLKHHSHPLEIGGVIISASEALYNLDYQAYKANYADYIEQELNTDKTYN